MDIVVEINFITEECELARKLYSNIRLLATAIKKADYDRVLKRIVPLVFEEKNSPYRLEFNSITDEFDGISIFCFDKKIFEGRIALIEKNLKPLRRVYRLSGLVMDKSCLKEHFLSLEHLLKKWSEDNQQLTKMS